MRECAIPIKSSYFENRDLLKLESTPSTVWVYVEDHDDINFWRNFFKDNKKYKFIIECVYLEDSSSASGCDQIKNLPDLGRYKIGCIDSDLNFILNAVHNTPKNYNTKYIYDTTYYSIENIIYSEKNIDNSIISSLNLSSPSQLPFTANQLIEKISSSSFNCFKKSIFLHKINPKFYRNLCKAFKNFKEVQYNELSDIFNSDSFILFEKDIKALESEADKEIKNHHKDFSDFSELLHDNSINENNFIRFIRGHSFERLIIKIYDSLNVFLLNNKIEKIRNSGSAKGHDITIINQHIASFTASTACWKKTIKQYTLEIENDDLFHNHSISRIKNDYLAI